MEVKDLANSILNKAVMQHSSDIFIFPKSSYFELKIRTDHGIKMLDELALEEGNELINYFKFIGEMDIAEHRRPQVGSLEKQLKSEKVYLRFSSMGDFYHREALVIRLIYSNRQNNYFFPDQFKKLENLSKQRGLIITSGPTGSGKTSTMYQLAKRLGQDKVVMSIEDPVEIYESSFLQTQINVTAEINYIDLLKAALRNRPDILIIGEIRDEQTANVAVNAALSGHLVLATVHAKSSIQTISRLEGLGIKKSELLNSLTAVSYQRLIWNQKLQEPACLFDIAHGEELKVEIQNKRRGDFLTWSSNLKQLRAEGFINDEQFAFFSEG